MLRARPCAENIKRYGQEAIELNTKAIKYKNISHARLSQEREALNERLKPLIKS